MIELLQNMRSILFRVTDEQVPLFASSRLQNLHKECRELLPEVEQAILNLEAAKPGKLTWRKVSTRGRDVRALLDDGRAYYISIDSPSAGGACNLWLPDATEDDFQDYETLALAKAAAEEHFEKVLHSTAAMPWYLSETIFNATGRDHNHAALSMVPYVLRDKHFYILSRMPVLPRQETFSLRDDEVVVLPSEGSNAIEEV